MTANRWAELRQVGFAALALAFGHRTVRFVPARGGRTGIVAVDVHATDREHGPGRGGELCHTMINFL